MGKNILIVVGLAIAFYIYLEFASTYLPDAWRVWVGIILVPLIVGAIAYWTLAGSFWLRLGLSCAIPLLVGIISPGDAAYPGLGIVVAIPFAAFACMGALSAAGIKKLRDRHVTQP